MKTPLSDPRGQLRNVLRLALARDQPVLLKLLLDMGEMYDRQAIERLPLPHDVKYTICDMAS